MMAVFSERVVRDPVGFTRLRKTRKTVNARRKKAGEKEKSPSNLDGLLKTTPPLPCRTRSLEHVLLHVELVSLLSASSKGMPATV